MYTAVIRGYQIQDFLEVGYCNRSRSDNNHSNETEMKHSPQDPASFRASVEVTPVQRSSRIVDVSLSSCLAERSVDLQLKNPCDEVPET